MQRLFRVIPRAGVLVAVISFLIAMVGCKNEPPAKSPEEKEQARQKHLQDSQRERSAK